MDLEWLAEALQLDEVFSEDLPLDNLLSSLPSLSLQAWPAGEKVLKEGERGEELYVVYTGRLSVWRRGDFDALKQIGLLEPGDFFGEIGFLMKSARSATVRTELKSKIFRFPAAEFSELLKKHRKLAAMVKQAAGKRLQKLFLDEA